MLWVQYEKYPTQSNNKGEGLICVTIDRDLNFHMHVSKAVNKASRMLELVRPTFTCMDKTTLDPQTIHHYSTPSFGIWKCGAQCSDVTSWKSRRAAKLLPNLRSLPYKYRFEALKLPSLYYRRRRCDMHQVYKILKGIDRLDLTNSSRWLTCQTPEGIASS